MKTYSVYKLIENNKCIYIGCTYNPNRRFIDHKSNKYKGRDIEMQIVKEFDDVEIAYYYEGYLKFKYGFRDKIVKDKWSHSQSIKGGNILAEINEKNKTGMNNPDWHKINVHTKSNAGKKSQENRKLNGLPALINITDEDRKLHAKHIQEKYGTKVAVYKYPTMEFVGNFNSLHEIQRTITDKKIDRKMIKGVLNNIYKQHNGYTFKYIN